MRSFHFKTESDKSAFKGIPDQNIYISSGLEVRKSIKIFGKRLEIPLILEIRQEMGFGIDSRSRSIYSEDYINLNAMGGLRYLAWHRGKHDLTIVGKLGLLGGLNSKSSIGIIYGLSAEYYLKIWKAISLEFDLYFDHYSQSYDELSMSRSELGLRSNTVFRF